MLLTQTLLGYLHRIFNKTPQPFTALQFNFATRHSTLSDWSVQDGVLAVFQDPGGIVTQFDLSAHTLQSLVAAMSAWPGFNVQYINPDYADLSALVLMDVTGSGAPATLYGYTAILWSILEAIAYDLGLAKQTADSAVLQLSLADGNGGSAAGGYWLSQLGSYFNVQKNTGESDLKYASRIIASVSKPKCNNVAIEMAIEDYTGLPATVTNVVRYDTSQVFNGSELFDGTHTFNGVGDPEYGLFDVNYQYNFSDGANPSDVLAAVTAIVENSRACGFHARNIAHV